MTVVQPAVYIERHLRAMSFLIINLEEHLSNIRLSILTGQTITGRLYLDRGDRVSELVTVIKKCGRRTAEVYAYPYRTRPKTHRRVVSWLKQNH